jgi:hypothetical protein
MTIPQLSVCSSWIDASDLQSQPWISQAIQNAQSVDNDGDDVVLSNDVINAILAQAASGATEILHMLSGQQFPGKCGPVTIRPVARPLNGDNLGAITRQWSYGGVGSNASLGSAMPSVVPHYGAEYAPEIILYDFPIREILEVKIDGVVIPPEEYELREFKKLIRVRPTSSFTPTERWGWPTSQIQDLPDTQEGTFSITYTYGQDPGTMGRLACIELAQAIALPMLGDWKRFPERMTAMTRQGVSAQVASFTDALANGGTGFYNIDLWLAAINPTKARRRGRVWSPDRARGNRQGRPSLPS